MGDKYIGAKCGNTKSGAASTGAHKVGVQNFEDAKHGGGTKYGGVK